MPGPKKPIANKKKAYIFFLATWLAEGPRIELMKEEEDKVWVNPGVNFKLVLSSAGFITFKKQVYFPKYERSYKRCWASLITYYTKLNHNSFFQRTMEESNLCISVLC